MVSEKCIYKYELELADPELVTVPKQTGKLDTNPDENVTYIKINRRGDFICLGTDKGSLYP